MADNFRCRITLKYACIKEYRLYYHLYLYIHEYYLFLYIANCFYSTCNVNKYKQFWFCHLQVIIQSLISHNFVSMLVLFELCSSSAEFCVFTRILWSSCLIWFHKRSLFVIVNHVKLWADFLSYFVNRDCNSFNGSVYRWIKARRRLHVTHLAYLDPPQTNKCTDFIKLWLWRNRLNEIQSLVV